ncbi:MAG TPA: NAD-dependent epimerase/dehydratase family protein [Vicinamibacterales bacterium]|jgi:nucleoside-diphosphate-sugar epimerase
MLQSADRVILVTGGGGFIGNRFAEVIHLSRFARVRVGVRRWASAARAARFSIDIALCDVLDPRQIASAMQGVDAVVHCAVGDERVIVDGTRNVLDAAARNRVSRVLHISTAEVYGSNVNGRVDETRPCTTTGSPYANAKTQAEQLVWQYSSRGLPVTIFRPSIVYGPWSDQWTAALAERLRSGRWRQYARYGEGTCNLVYVDDLVAAALSSIRSDRAVGEAFNVGGADIVTWNEYFDRFNQAMGLPPLEVRSAQRTKAKSIAAGAVRTTAQLLLARHRERLRDLSERGGWVSEGMKGLKRWMNTTPSPSELDDLYSRRAIYDWSKAQRLLDYRPAFDLDRGLRLSVDWLRYAGLLN